MTRFEFPNGIAVNYELLHRSIYADYLRLLASGTPVLSVSTFFQDVASFTMRFNSAAKKQIDDYLAVNTFGASESAVASIGLTERVLLSRLDTLVAETVKHYAGKLRVKALFGDKRGFTDREFDFRVRDMGGKMLDPLGYATRAASAFAVDIYFLAAVDALKRKGAHGKIVYPSADHKNNGVVFDPNDAKQVADVATFFHPNTAAQVIQNAISS